MGKRLTQIATRTGDDGTTGLADGSRLPKDHVRLVAIGEVDELNSNLGLLMCEPMPARDLELLVEIQHQLFNVGGELSLPGAEVLPLHALTDLDLALKERNAALPPLQEFILPGGTRAAAQAHVCRTVARRAERALVCLAASEPVRALLRQYLNRLSDLMFVLARGFNRASGNGDVYWRSDRLKRAQE